MGAFLDAMKVAIEKEKLRRTKVLRRAVRLLHDEAIRTVFEGGRLPYKQGRLKRSLTVSTAAKPTIASDDIEFGDNTSQNLAAIAGFELGKTLYIGYRAAHALRLNYGFTGQDSLGRIYNTPGYGFFEILIQRWPLFVKQAEKEIGR